MAGPCMATPSAAAGSPAFARQGHPAMPPFLDGAVGFSFKINAHGHLTVELQPLSSPPLENTPKNKAVSTDMK